MRERESTGFGGGVKTNLFNLVVAMPRAAGAPGRRRWRPCWAGGRHGSSGSPPDRDGAAGATVSGRCSPGTLDRGVCLEEIDVAAGGDPLGVGAGAWTPLLARDIPTFLWIAGAWTPANLPPDAAAHADKLIVDGSLADDAPAALAALHRLREATRGRLAVADLAWSRTLPLRVQAARAFDPPEARDALDGLAAVRLAGGTRSEALLFFLWLASRLGWRPSAGRDGPSFADPAGRTVSLVHENPAPLAGGARLSFAVRGAGRRGLVLARTGARRSARTGAPGGSPRTASCCWPKSTRLKQDPLLDDALGMAGRSFRARGP